MVQTHNVVAEDAPVSVVGFLPHVFMALYKFRLYCIVLQDKNQAWEVKI